MDSPTDEPRPEESLQDGAELVIGSKRMATEEVPNPRVAKHPYIEASTPKVGELDQLAALLNGTWDKVVEVRAAMGAAEGRL